MGGIISSINKRYDKKNRPWAIIELHGIIGKADIFIFNDCFEKYSNLLKEDNCLFFIGKPSNKNESHDELKIIANEIYLLNEIREKLSRCINILLNINHTDEGLLENINQLANNNKGRCGLILHLKSKNGSVQKIRSRQLHVNPNQKFIVDLRSICGDNNVWIS